MGRYGARGLFRRLTREDRDIATRSLEKVQMLACADRKETWIDDVILESYCLLHQAGFAHSIECWDDDGLQGGLYGVELPGVFFGESMFSRKTDASKIALVALVENLRSRSFHLLDTQWLTEHLKQFGGYELTRKQYHAALTEALRHGDQEK